MEYQNIANLLDNEAALSASNKPSKFRTRRWVEINDEIRGAYSPNNQIRFKTAMLRSRLCDYNDAYILVKWNISVNNTAVGAAAADNTNKKVIFKRTISWNKYLSKPELLAHSANLNHLVEPSFQEINRLFVLAFENDAQRTSNKKYYIS